MKKLFRLSHWKLFFSFCLLTFFLSCDNEPYDGPLFFDVALTCEEASDNLIISEDNFENADSTNYEEFCLEYQEAIQDYIDSCPDEDHTALNAILSSLDECELTSFFQVDFDGTTFFADAAQAEVGLDHMTITGVKNGNGEKVEIILNATELGSYTLGIEEANNTINIAQYSPDSDNINQWQSFTDGLQPQGEITITEIDYFNATISGNFNFTSYDSSGSSKEFTEGSFFNIPLIKIDDFFALVDGEEFVDVQIVPGINNFGWIGLQARDGQGGDITIAVNYNIVPGTYDFSTEPGGQRTIGFTPSFEDFHIGDGSITITTHNPETNLLMGTFSCTALPINGGVGIYEITEGRFCVTYLEGDFED